MRRLVPWIAAVLVSASPALAADPISLKLDPGSVRSSTASGTTSIVFSVAASDREALADWTKRHLRAPLVVTLDGEVVSRPRLQEPLTSGALAIAFPDAAQARAFVEKLRAGKGALGIEAE